MKCRIIFRILDVVFLWDIRIIFRILNVVLGMRNITEHSWNVKCLHGHSITKSSCYSHRRIARSPFFYPPFGSNEEKGTSIFLCTRNNTHNHWIFSSILTRIIQLVLIFYLVQYSSGTTVFPLVATKLWHETVQLNTIHYGEIFIIVSNMFGSFIILSKYKIGILENSF